MKMLVFLNPRPGAKASGTRKRRQSHSKTTNPMATKSRRRGHRKATRNPSRKHSATRVRRTRSHTPRRAARRRNRVIHAIALNPRRKRSHRRTIRNPRRSGYRRHARRNPGFLSGGGGLLGMAKGAFSKDNLTLAGGILGATVLARVLVNKFGKDLPMVNSTDVSTKNNGVLLYSLGLPMVAAFAVRKTSPALAKGLVIGGLVNTIVTWIAQNKKDVYAENLAPVSAYLNAGAAPRNLIGGAVGAPMPYNRTPSYQASNLFSRISTTNGPLDNANAFPGAWAGSN